jgi:hypothetical protein
MVMKVKNSFLFFQENPAPPLYSQNNSADPGRSRNSDAISSSNNVLPEAGIQHFYFFFFL